MGRSTRATKALEQAGVAFSVHEYAYDPGADRVGLQAAEALGEAPARVLKTLMVLADSKPACAILASDREVSMKKLAASLGAKSASMMAPADAERLSGYKVGGISPFGQARQVNFWLAAGTVWRETPRRGERPRPNKLLNGGNSNGARFGGDRGWTLVVLETGPIHADAHHVSYGFNLEGTGDVWVDAPRLEVVAGEAGAGPAEELMVMIGPEEG